MREKARGAIVLPFPPDYRASGILAHITSLPTDRGIGDFGPAARLAAGGPGVSGASCANRRERARVAPVGIWNARQTSGHL
jgi:hypothetical protein